MRIRLVGVLCAAALVAALTSSSQVVQAQGWVVIPGRQHVALDLPAAVPGW